MAKTKVRVVNKFGVDVKQDGIEQGEVIVKGPSIINGDQTLQTTPDGWLYTGDVGTMDEHGNIKVMRPDLTKQDGKSSYHLSVYEIESAFNSHPAILESAVLIVPDAEYGETFHAFIVLRPNLEISEAELIQFSREKLNKTTLLKIMITFSSKLPRTTSGKILKERL